MTESKQSILHDQIIASLRIKESFRFKVSGNCMQPLIQKGDWVIIAPLGIDRTLHQGEIVLVDRGVDFVVHRIVFSNDSRIITRGDWTGSFDPPAKRENILGQVVLIEKHWCKLRLTNPIIHLINRTFFYLASLYQKNISSQ